MDDARDDFEFGELSGIDPREGWTPPPPVKRDWPADDAEFVAAYELELENADDEVAFTDADPQAFDRYNRILEAGDTDDWDEDDEYSDYGYRDPFYGPKPELGPAVSMPAKPADITPQMDEQLSSLLHTLRS